MNIISSNRYYLKATDNFRTGLNIFLALTNFDWEPRDKFFEFRARRSIGMLHL